LSRTLEVQPVTVADRRNLPSATPPSDGAVPDRILDQRLQQQRRYDRRSGARIDTEGHTQRSPKRAS